ncbi:MAG: response regulator transcription factor, partial [Eubacteriales bacterium]|nr:response regulator transcription factor [Eubacteriales bacterium]
PNMNGIDALRIIKEQKMLCKVIMLTRHNEIDYLMKALEIGCDGYILKESSFDTLKKAIFKVYSGDKYIEPNMMPLLNANMEEKSNVKKKISELTRREIDVLKMIASGAFNKEIASTLNISERTVKNHVSNIFKKIEVSDRTQAAVFAIKNGIISVK